VRLCSSTEVVLADTQRNAEAGGLGTSNAQGTGHTNPGGAGDEAGALLTHSPQLCKSPPLHHCDEQTLNASPDYRPGHTLAASWSVARPGRACQNAVQGHRKRMPDRHTRAVDDGV
jgi:hypothetical protein